MDFVTFRELPATGNLAELVPDAATATDTERLYLAQLLGITWDAMRALGIPAVTLTSWLRPDDVGDPHAAGAALDFAGPSREATADLWVWIAQNRRSSIGELELAQPIPPGITGHVHATLPGWGGRGQILYQTEDGGFLELDPFLASLLHRRGDPHSRRRGDRGPQ